MDDWNTLVALERLAFEATAISRLVSLISDYEKEGTCNIECYSDAIWYVSECANKNASAINKTVKHLFEIRKKRAQQ